MFVMDIQREGRTCRAAVTGDLTIFEAAEWHGRMKETVAEGRALALDLSGVIAFDVSALQILLWTARRTAQQELPFQVEAVSDPVREAFQLLGLEDELGRHLCGG